MTIPATSEPLYTRNWSRAWKDNCRRHVVPHLFGKESTDSRSISFLEIGCFEGRGTIWTMDTLLKHPQSHAYTIDPWDAYHYHGHHDGRTIRERAEANLAPYVATGRCTVFRGFSHEVLHDWKYGPHDLILIDGNHTYRDAMRDSVLCWKHLRPGGVLVWDDVGLEKFAPVRKAIKDFLRTCPYKSWRPLIPEKKQFGIVRTK